MGEDIAIDDCCHLVFAFYFLSFGILQFFHYDISHLGITSMFAASLPFLACFQIFKGLSIHVGIAKKVDLSLLSDIIEVVSIQFRRDISILLPHVTTLVDAAGCYHLHLLIAFGIGRKKGREQTGSFFIRGILELVILLLADFERPHTGILVGSEVDQIITGYFVLPSHCSGNGCG